MARIPWDQRPAAGGSAHLLAPAPSNSCAHGPAVNFPRRVTKNELLDLGRWDGGSYSSEGFNMGMDQSTYDPYHLSGDEHP